MAGLARVNRTPRNRRAPRRTAPARQLPSLVKPGVNRGRFLAVGFVTLIVCSLLGGALGTAFFDSLGDDGGSELDLQSGNGEFERQLRDRLEANPNDIGAMAALADLLAGTSRLTEAIPWYERALGAAPNDAAVRLDFAEALAKGEKPLDAEVQYKRVLELEPASPGAHFGIAVLYRDWTPPRSAEANAHFQDVIAIAPDSFFAERARDELGRGGTPVSATPIAVTGSPPAATPRP